MRVLSISTLGWLGGVAASGAVLSLVATGKENAPPQATERVADVFPEAFSSGNATGDFGQELHGMEGPSHVFSLNLNGERTAAGLDGNGSLDKIGSRGTDGFSSGEIPQPTLPVSLFTVPPGGPVNSQSANPFPSSAPGNAPAGATKVSGAESSPVPTGYFIVSNDGGLGSAFGVGVPRAVPEPSSWALGLVAVGAFIYGRGRAVRR